MGSAEPMSSTDTGAPSAAGGAASERARAWLAAEPDADIRAELAALIDGPPSELQARFEGSLQFGTAGLRAAIGAGPLRMNRLVVRQAAAGLGDHLLATVADIAERGVVIGFDARHKSDTFAQDSARVLAARGVPVRLFDHPVPTPVVAWSITEVGAAAGVVVTASHNPPGDNGYKVYLGTGSQIVSPTDREIAARIAAVDPLDIALAPIDDPRIAIVGDELVNGYTAFAAGSRLCPDIAPVPVAYSALHGVGAAVLVDVFDRAGLGRPAIVVEQNEPDPGFSTVAFPNPEEPGAMDRVIETARRHGAAVAIANDPDADRLGVAVIGPDGTARRLSGDEIGWLLADHVLRHTSGDDRLVITTLVSSSLLGAMAAEYGVHYCEVYTGFKWIAHAALERPHLRLVFAYEQALGYLVGDRPLDKDGITAAVMMAEIAALAAAEHTDLDGRLADIARRFGTYRTAEVSVPMPPELGSAAVERLRAAPPTMIGDTAVAEVIDFAEAGLLRLILADGTRLQIRPSGTEPKVKLYGQRIDGDPRQALDQLAALIAD